MTNEPSPRPWRYEVDSLGRAWIRDADGNSVWPNSESDVALIVDAVNHMDYDLSIRTELNDARAEIDRLRDALTRKAQNYEDVIAYHRRTEESLRDIVRRLADLSESLLANYEYRYREDANSMAFVENTRGFLREARAAIGEEKE